MATFRSNNYDGRVLRLEVWQSGGTCYWQLFSEGGGANYYTIYNLSISINGQSVYAPGTVRYSTQRFPAAKGSTSGSVWIGNGAGDRTIYVSFVGAVYYNRSTQNGGNFTMYRYIYAPALSGISISSVGDKSAYASFSVTNANGQDPYSPYIDLSLSNWGSAVKTINARSGTFSGLDPNRTYYVRGNDANDGGRTYTNVGSFTTTFNNPGSPGRPILSYDQTEPIPQANLQATWTAAPAGSTAIAGYRLVLYKNNQVIKTIDTESSGISYNFGTFESLGIEPGDSVKVGIYAYCKDWNNGKHFTGDGASSSEVLSSNTITVVSDKYIYVSVNNGEFIKHKMYISQNGGSFEEVKKEKFKVI